MIKKIGIMTSGGDCAGLNMAIKAATTHATQHYGWQVVGIHEGTMGLLSDPLRITDLSHQPLSSFFSKMGGTFLGTTIKGNPAHFPDNAGGFSNRISDVIANCKALEIDALITIGGDGSLKILHDIFSPYDIPVIGIPKTIDNDLGCTDYAIGFSTAVDIAVEALDRLQPTAASHSRLMVLEVMGRDAGHIALHAGIAGEADLIIIPEIAYDIKVIEDYLTKLYENKKNHALMIVSESVKAPSGEVSMIADPYTGAKRYGGIGQYFSTYLTQSIHIESRSMTLGHLQRGAAPNATDRILATAFGVKAVDLLAQGKGERMVAWRNQQVIDVSIKEAIDHYRGVDPNGEHINIAKAMGISFGCQ